MRITLDPEADAIYIELQTGTFVTNREVAEGVILGIEILEAEITPERPLRFSLD
jgi:uncharacterized protein YuzE